MEKGKISFKPLHEGMGFHPFSDGLPYAPESKAKYQNGAGANAAGRPQFVGQTTNPQSRVAVKTARQLQSAATTQTTIKSHQPLERMAPPNVAQTQVAKKPNETSETTSSLLRRRAFAYLLDCVIHAGFWVTTNLAALFLFKFQIDGEIVRENLGQFLVFLMISQWIFIALQEVLFETTMGKAFFNLEFKRNHRSLFLRSVLFMLGSISIVGFFARPQDKLGEIQLKSKLNS